MKHKTITRDELKRKLELHALWLDDNTKGERLELGGYDLPKRSHKQEVS